MKPLYTLALVAAMTAIQTSSFAQLELASISPVNPVSGPTTLPQTARLVLDAANNGTFTTPTTTLNVTLSVSNQVYTMSGITAPVCFGAFNNSAGSTASGVPVLVPFTGSGSVGAGTPSDAMFTNSSTPGTGISATSNYTFQLYTAVQFSGTNIPDYAARTRMADLTISFSQPVSNPILHLSGLGGITGTLGYSTEFNLAAGSPYSFTKLSGDAELVVTSTQINNGAAAINANCGSGAACGSVRVNGSNITSIVLEVYINGDGGGTSWTSSGAFVGDRYSLSVSLPKSYNISGTLFDDANGTANSLIDGTAIGNPGGVQQYANLINTNTGFVVGSIQLPLATTTGQFNFTGIDSGGNYALQISQNPGTVGAAAPARSLPTTNWIYTAEGNTGTGDGTPDGAFSFSNVTANSTGVNFGIEQLPLSDNKSYSVAKTDFASIPPTGYPVVAGYTSIKASSTALTGGGSPTGSDPEDCASASSCSAGKVFSVESINANTKLYYNNGAGVVAITAGTSLLSFDPTKLVIYGQIGSGITGSPVGFTYKLVDADNQKSPNAATYSIVSSTPLPMELSDFGAQPEQGEVHVYWATALEKDVRTFEVERSGNGITYEPLGSVAPKGSGSTYAWQDTNPFEGNNYYRLRTHELNGSTSISMQVLVRMSKTGNAGIRINPNPATDKITLTGASAGARIGIYDLSGKLHLDLAATGNIQDIPTGSLPAGIYMVRITGAGLPAQVLRITKQ